MKKRQIYLAPAIEIMEVEHEGVMANSGNLEGYGSGNNGDPIQVGGMQAPGFDLAEYENIINDLFTTIND